MLAAAQRSSGDDFQKAISQFDKCIELFEQLGDITEAGIAEIWAAQFLVDVGKIVEARRRLLPLIASAENRKFKILLTPSYYWLTIADYHQNEISKSNKQLKAALHLAETSENAFEAQHIQETLASLYSELDELEPALFYAGKMFNERELYYQNRGQYWREKGTLADIALQLGFNATALSLARETLGVAQEQWPGTGRVNDSLTSVIAALAAQEDLGGALKYANASMQLTLDRGAKAENTRATADINLLLADLKSKSKDFNGALTNYDRALELYRNFPEFTDSLYRVHKGRLYCFQQLNRQGDFSSELITVLELSEKYRTTIREDETRQAFFATEQDVFDMAATNAISEHDSQKAFKAIEESRARSLLDFVESDRPIAEVEKGFGPVAQPLLLSEIQARLPEQVQVLQYAVLPDRLAIWIVSKSRFDFVEKQITALELEKKIDTFQELITDQGNASEIRQAARELYELLIPPGLSAEKQLCVIPDKSLHRLAFASLVSSTGRWLLEEYALFYSPSASVLVLASENAHRKEQVLKESILSIGNPDFDREENPNLAGLWDAETEAKTITGDYPKSFEFIGADATKDKFLLNFANAEVVHFAGHFVANPRSPGNSKLLFAGGELRSNQLSAYKLPKAKLVVLSACETGFERYNKSEGAIGIARTLLALGAPIVVASQWKVDSETTKNLMIAFHHNRKQKRMSSAESLRRAQLEVLSKDETKAPFFWAAFSMFGAYANY